MKNRFVGKLGDRDITDDGGFIMIARIPLLMLGLVLSSCGGGSQPTAPAAKDHSLLTMDEVIWGPARPVVPVGAQFAIIQGDPTAPGVPYTFRVKVTAGGDKGWQIVMVTVHSPATLVELK